MTEEYLLKDVPWDNEEAIIDREPESSGDGRHHFGFLRLYPLAVTKVFEAGKYVTIPSITGGDFNDKDANGLMMFKGWREGGDQYLFVMVATKQTQQGGDYQIVKQFPSKLPRKGDPHLWADFILPALKKLSNAERGKMTSEGVYAEWDEIGTGHEVEFEDSGKLKKVEVKAWGNFKVYPDKASLDKASNEFFAQFNNGNNNVTGSIYPKVWGKTDQDIQKMLDWATNQTPEYADHKDLAVKLFLIDEKTGKVALTEGGQKVDVRNILSQVLDTPEPMIKL